MTAPVLYTTLWSIRYHLANPFALCAKGLARLIRFTGRPTREHAPLLYSDILKSNGLADCLLAMNCTDKWMQPRADLVLRAFACICAYRALPAFERLYPADERPRAAIEAGWDFQRGLIDRAALEVAWTKASGAIADALKDALPDKPRNAAQNAAHKAARRATSSAAWAASADVPFAARWAGWSERNLRPRSRKRSEGKAQAAALADLLARVEAL